MSTEHASLDGLVTYEEGGVLLCDRNAATPAVDDVQGLLAITAFEVVQECLTGCNESVVNDTVRESRLTTRPTMLSLDQKA